nr:Nodulation protein D 2 [Paraburkholderia busanensis]
MNRSDISDVDLNLLKIFEALYEEGGASRAAIRLDMTQSAVSAALRRLRALYADQMFVRTGRGLTPTSRASELKPLVSEALDKFRQSLAIAAPNPADFSGRAVAIGMSDDFELAIGRKLMALMAKRAPGLRVIFRQTHSQIVTDALANQEMDLAIAAGGFSLRGLGRQVLGKGRYACLVDPDSLHGRSPHDPRHPPHLSLDDFAARDHILVSSGGVVGIVDEMLAAAGRKRRVAASTTHFAALPYLLKGTEAVATIPTHAAHAIAGMTGLLLLPCPLALPEYPIEVGWRINALRDAAVVKVQTALAECFDPAQVKLA